MFAHFLMLDLNRLLKKSYLDFTDFCLFNRDLSSPPKKLISTLKKCLKKQLPVIAKMSMTVLCSCSIKLQIVEFMFFSSFCLVNHKLGDNHLLLSLSISKVDHRLWKSFFLSDSI